MGNRITITTKLEQLQEVARQLIGLFGDKKIIAFYGEMGAGKTTVIKAICHYLGCIDNVSSPTFSILNEYFTENGDTVYHFDFYRLKNIWEALDIGIEDYLNSSHYCFMEWPEKIAELLPDDYVKVIITKGEMPDTGAIEVIIPE